jgi:CO/xanthine dehydrogenase FAD-binding subunit
VQTPGPIEYARATSVDNAIALLAERGPDARVIAGGHSLLPMMKLRLANPELLVDINDLADLAYIREQDGQVRIGAMTRHHELLESELLARHFPVFADAEILTEIRIPLKPGGGSAHEKVERRAGDWAIVAVSGAVWMDGDRIADAGLALSAVGLTTIHATRAEELMRGKAPSEELWGEVATTAAEDCSPTADGRGPVDYKRHLAGELSKRALRRAVARARGQEG